jgi:type I restriction enzyme R subunit
VTVLNKKQMSEEDIKLNYITPAIQPGWSGHITMETKITDGRINIKGNMVARSKPKFADYLLYLNGGKPLAVVEAKDNNHSVSFGSAAGDDIRSDDGLCRLHIRQTATRSMSMIS